MKKLLQIFALILLAGCGPPPDDKTVSSNALEQAIQTGDASRVKNSSDLLDAALESIEQNKNLFSSARSQIFNLATGGSPLTAISWDPSHDASLLTATFGVNEPILTTNSVAVDGYTVYQKPIGIIGETGNSNKGKSRYMVLGSNPMRNAYRDEATVNPQMHQFMENSLGWLIGRNDLKTKNWNVVIAQMEDGYYFPDDKGIRQWLDQHYPGKVSYNIKNACNGTLLADCISQGADMLIISQVMQSGENAKGIAATVKSAMDQGIPVLYMHNDGDLQELGAVLFPLFAVGYEWDNYWKKLSLTNFDASQKLNALPIDILAIQKMLLHFKNKNFSVNLNLCDDKSCSANAENDTAYKAEFKDGADRVRTMANEYDAGKTNLFASEDSHDRRFQKLLILLGDQYRQEVVYPMDKSATEKTAFLKSFFSDHAVYNFRSINSAQKDMGNFSRSDFDHITPVNKRVTLTSKKNFKAAGVYALPGQTFKVTRTDNSSVETSIFINTIRSGMAMQALTRIHIILSQNSTQKQGKIRVAKPYPLKACLRRFSFLHKQPILSTLCKRRSLRTGVTVWVFMCKS